MKARSTHKKSPKLAGRPRWPVSSPVVRQARVDAARRAFKTARTALGRLAYGCENGLAILAVLRVAETCGGLLDAPDDALAHRLMLAAEGSTLEVVARYYPESDVAVRDRAEARARLTASASRIAEHLGAVAALARPRAEDDAEELHGALLGIAAAVYALRCDFDALSGIAAAVHTLLARGAS